jgi:hypothetical protein
VKRKAKCPKCRRSPYSFIENWSGTLEFGVDANGEPEEEGILNPGSPLSVDGTCECGHRWTLRGITQITELRQAKGE